MEAGHFAHSRFTWTESQFAQSMKSFRLRIENKSFSTGSKNTRIKLSSRFFSDRSNNYESNTNEQAKKVCEYSSF